MSRHINDFDENIILQVVSGFLIHGMSHREIQKIILGLPAPARGGGFVAMDILHHYGITRDFKGYLKKWESFDMSSISDLLSRDIIEKVLYVEHMKKNVTNRINHKIYDLMGSNTTIKKETIVRVNQYVLRNRVLDNYNHECAICDIKNDDLLVCSHIKPWALDEINRLNPRNAISLCVLHDKLFDRGYFSIDKDFKVIVSKKCDNVLKTILSNAIFKKPVLEEPDLQFLEFHLTNVHKY